MKCRHNVPRFARDEPPKKASRKLLVLGKAHAANIIVEDNRSNFKKGRAKDPILHAGCAMNRQEALVIIVTEIHGCFREFEGLSCHLEAQLRRVLATVVTLIRSIIRLLNRNAIELLQQRLHFFVRAGNYIRTSVGNSILNLVSIEFDANPPERIIGVLVRPSNETTQLKEVNLANVETGPTIGAESKLIRAGLDKVLLLGGPHKRLLVHAKATVFRMREGETKGTASAIAIKVLFAVTNGNISGLDAANGDLVRIKITIDMETSVRKVKSFVQILGCER